MKMIVTTVQAWCDYPGCQENAEANNVDGQETSTVQFWFYVNAKGRKTQPITVELCDDHRDELKSVYQHMSKFDQKDV